MNHSQAKAQAERNLRVLNTIDQEPELAYESDSEVRHAFDSELRQLAEDIVRYHPSLTHLLLSLGAKDDSNLLAGSN